MTIDVGRDSIEGMGEWVDPKSFVQTGRASSFRELRVPLNHERQHVLAWRQAEQDPATNALD